LSSDARQKFFGNSIFGEKLVPGLTVGYRLLCDAIGFGGNFFLGDGYPVVGLGGIVDDVPLDLESEELGKLILGDGGSVGLDQGLDLTNGHILSVHGCRNGTGTTATGGEDHGSEHDEG